MTCWRLLAAASVSWAAAAAPAAPQPLNRFDIPAGPLDVALRAVARAAHVQILFDGRDTRGRRVAALSGLYTVQEALARLTRPLALEVRRSAGGAYLVRPTSIARAETGRSAVRSRAIAPTPAPPAAAPLEDIVVTGTRAALRSAEQLKRRAEVTLDALSADQIGQLPDVSISESLIRMAGVSSNDDPRGSGQVALRGLGPDLVATQINGRVLPTYDIDTRRVILGGLPTEGIDAAIAQKTTEAATIEGGVAGILDLRTIRPFETSRSGLTVALRGLYGDTPDQLSRGRHFAPFGVRGEITYVGHFSDAAALSFSYAGLKQFSATTGYSLEGWRLGAGQRADLDVNGTADALPANAGVMLAFQQNTRHSVLSTLQLQPSGSLRLTLDGMYIADLLRSGPIRFFANNLFNGVIGAATGTVDGGSTVTSFAGDAALYRINLNDVDRSSPTYGAGLSVALDTGPVTATADLSYSRAGTHRRTPFARVENRAPTAVAQRIPFAYDIRDPARASFTFLPLGPSDYALAEFTITELRSKDAVAAARADMTVEIVDVPLLRAFGFGARIEDHLHYKKQDGTSWNFALASRPVLDASYLANTVNPLRGSAGSFGGPTAVAFPYFAVNRLQRLVDAPGAQMDDEFQDDVVEGFRVRETSYAVYGEAKLRAGSLSGNVGLRYVLTDQEVSAAVGTTPASAVPQHDGRQNGALLPSANLRVDVTDAVTLRLAVTRTLSRPLYSDLRIGAAIDPASASDSGPLLISRGNARLKPFTAAGIDAGVEWYPGRNAFITVATFYKRVRNFTRQVTFPSSLTLANGTSVPVILTTMTNDPATRYLAGFELSARRELSFLPGFLRDLGVQGNYTHVATDIVDSPLSLLTTRVDVRPNNLSRDIVNAQLYYTTRTADLRLAYRYYSPYYRGIDTAFQAMPGGQFDFAGSIVLRSRLRLVASATNLLGTRYLEYQPDHRDPAYRGVLHRYAYRGRQITIGLRAQLGGGPNIVRPRTARSDAATGPNL